MKQMHYFRWGMLLLVVVAWFTACTQGYSSAAFSAQVIDGDTRQPLAGVNVVAHWQLMGGLEGGRRLGALTAMEAVTDANGKFTFPAWGPKRVYSFPSWNGIPRIRASSPEIYFFKSGYHTARRLNDRNTGEYAPSHMQSESDRAVIPLTRFRGDRDAYINTVAYLSEDLIGSTARLDADFPGGAALHTACQWEHIPRMIQALRREQENFAAMGVHHRAFIYDELVDNAREYRRARCAWPTKVLKKDDVPKSGALDHSRPADSIAQKRSAQPEKSQTQG